jgi:hypothetical protein
MGRRAPQLGPLVRQAKLDASSWVKAPLGKD